MYECNSIGDDAEKHYTGVGSREVPTDIAGLMTRIAIRLRARGFKLRSGHADGSDTAFENGAGEDSEIYIPWKGFNGSKSMLYSLPREVRAAEIAESVHPRWGRLKPAVRSLHTRNVYQVLGKTLDTPSRFLICWTKDGAQTEQERSVQTGGTGTAIVLAARHKIPVINLARPDAMERLAQLVLKDAA